MLPVNNNIPAQESIEKTEVKKENIQEGNEELELLNKEGIVNCNIPSIYISSPHSPNEKKVINSTTYRLI